jgi:hypothetical protein
LYVFRTVIWTNEQDAQPRSVIALWKAKIEEPKFQQTDPALSIIDQATSKSFLMKLLSSSTNTIVATSYAEAFLVFFLWIEGKRRLLFSDPSKSLKVRKACIEPLTSPHFAV